MSDPEHPDMLRHQVWRAGGDDDGTSDLPAAIHTSIWWVVAGLVLVWAVWHADRMRFESEVGVPVSLLSISCGQMAVVPARACYRLELGRQVRLPEGDRLRLRLLTPDLWRENQLLEFRLVANTSGPLSAQPILEIEKRLMDRYPARQRVRASLVTGSRETSVLQVLLQEWRRLLAG
ncbi:hypothetical protein [Duganella sp. S19_KUP01_CR8]|uniref:hypothetical protein n=1 Tax=Duganella sp. S19_KUP01_CR8 TaxID=3025502 RepID=UPI002FCDA4FB